MLTGTLRRIRRAAPRARAALGHALQDFFDDDAPQSAGAISYYALFSLFPLAILLVVALGLVVDDGAARGQVVDFLLNYVPLDEDRGRRQREEVLTSVTQNTSGFGIAGGLGLVIAASGVMGAIRKAINRAWDVEDRRPFVQAKIVDVLLIFGLGLLMALSFALTLVARLAVSVSAELEPALGTTGSAASRVVLGLDQMAPVLVAFAVFLTLFRVVPAMSTRLRDVWPAAAVAALGFEAAKTAFALYLEHFANYSAVYSSLAAVIAFLVFVFVSANILLLGAEIAAAWPRVREARISISVGPPISRRLRRGLVSLFVRRDR